MLPASSIITLLFLWALSNVFWSCKCCTHTFNSSSLLCIQRADDKYYFDLKINKKRANLIHLIQFCVDVTWAAIWSPSSAASLCLKCWICPSCSRMTSLYLATAFNSDSDGDSTPLGLVGGATALAMTPSSPESIDDKINASWQTPNQTNQSDLCTSGKIRDRIAHQQPYWFESVGVSKLCCTLHAWLFRQVYRRKSPLQYASLWVDTATPGTRHDIPNEMKLNNSKLITTALLWKSYCWNHYWRLYKVLKGRRINSVQAPLDHRVRWKPPKKWKRDKRRIPEFVILFGDVLLGRSERPLHSVVSKIERQNSGNQLAMLIVEWELQVVFAICHPKNSCVNQIDRIDYFLLYLLILVGVCWKFVEEEKQARHL